MLICIMRHGDAEAYSGEATDATRELTARGRSGNCRVAEQLKQKQATFDQIWVSPFVRAQQTADDVLALFPENKRESCAALTPESRPQELLEMLATKGGDSLLLIGHNPLVSRLVALLLDGGTAPERYLGTSELLAVKTEVAAPACGVVKYYLSP